MTDHDQNEAALTLAGMISTTRPFAELHPSAAVPIAAQIVDAIRAGKVPGISDDAGIASMERQLDAAAKALDALRAERDVAQQALYIYIGKCSDAERDRDAALARVKEVEGERERFKQAASAWCGDMTTAANACGRTDDEYPLQAVIRCAKERDALKADNERLRGLLREAHAKLPPEASLCEMSNGIKVRNSLAERIDQELSQ